MKNSFFFISLLLFAISTGLTLFSHLKVNALNWSISTDKENKYRHIVDSQFRKYKSLRSIFIQTSAILICASIILYR
jgi:hypothetical protein